MVWGGFEVSLQDTGYTSYLFARIDAGLSADIYLASVGVGLAGYSAYWALKKMYNWGVDAAETVNETLTGESTSGAILGTVPGGKALQTFYRLLGS